MKNKFVKLFTIITATVSVFTVAACYDDEEIDVTKVEFVDNSISTIFEIDSTVSFENAKFAVTYSDDSTEEISAIADTSALDVTTEDTYSVVFTLSKDSIKSNSVFASTLELDDNGDYSITKEIMIVEEFAPTDYTFVTMGPNSSLAKFNNIEFESTVSNLDHSLEKDKYLVDLGATQYYTVGTANDFQIPLIYYFNVDGEVMTTTEYGISTIELFIYNDNTSAYDLLDTDLSQYAEINDSTSTINFTNSAVDNVFKIVVTESLSGSDRTLIIENVSVVKGYNVYTANELSVLNNYTGRIDNGSDAWAVFKDANNIPTEDVAVDGVILHNDLTITTANIPSYYITTVNGLESFIDDVDVYTRRHANGADTYNFIGNYFTVDASRLPIIQPETGDFVHSDANLFGFGSYRSDKNVAMRGDILVKNMTVVANAQRSEEMSLYGGLNNFATMSNNFTLETVNTLNAVLMVYVHGLDYVTDSAERISLTSANKLNLHNVRAYDAFSTMILSWGAAQTTITNSDLRDAGGPIWQGVDTTTTSEQETDGTYTDPTLSVDENSFIESFVSGQEAWFQSNGATTMAGNILAINDAIEGNSALFGTATNTFRTMLNPDADAPVFNLLVVLGASSLTNSNSIVNGRISLGSSHTVDTRTAAYNNGAFPTALGMGAPVFVSNNVGIAFDGSTSFVDYMNNPISSDGAADATTFFTGTDKYVDLHIKPVPSGSTVFTMITEFYTDTVVAE